MLDLIVLIFLVDYIGKLARKKGLNVLQWRLRLFFYWMGAELMIGLLSLSITHQIYVASISGLLAGLLAGLIVFQWFKKVSETFENEPPE